MPRRVTVTPSRPPAADSSSGFSAAADAVSRLHFPPSAQRPPPGPQTPFEERLAALARSLEPARRPPPPAAPATSPAVEPSDRLFEEALASAADAVETGCTKHNVDYFTYQLSSFPIPPSARADAARAVLSRTLAAREGDARAALVEAMVSFHHAYQASRMKKVKNEPHRPK
eukprot:2005779-Pleurochrysis_carterae.AAC.1